MTEQYTKTTTDCETIQELIPDYAFGLTSPDETRLVESHLAACPEAAAQLEDYQLIQANLRAGVPQIDPPPQLEERLMAAVTAPAAPRPARRSFHPAWLLAAAAVLALIVTNIYWFTRTDDLTQQRDQLVAQIRGQNSAAFVLTSTTALQWVRLPPSQEESDSSAFMMWDAQSDTGLLYAHAFPQLETGKTYQLWLSDGQTRLSGGTFRVDEKGNGALLFRISAPIDRFTRAGVTTEPESGSSEPTGAPVVRGEL